MDNFQYLDFLNNTFQIRSKKRKKQKVNLNRDQRSKSETPNGQWESKERGKTKKSPKKRENVKEKKEKVRGRLHLEVPKKIWSHIRRFKRTHIHPIRLFASLNVALSRHQKKSLDLTRFSRVQFSSSKWGWGLKILSSTIITDILTMSSPVFARRMVPLMLFRARECEITHYRVNSCLIDQQDDSSPFHTMLFIM